MEFLTGVSDSRRASGGVSFWVSVMLVDSLVKMNLDHWRGALGTKLWMGFEVLYTRRFRVRGEKIVLCSIDGGEGA